MLGNQSLWLGHRPKYADDWKSLAKDLCIAQPRWYSEKRTGWRKANLWASSSDVEAFWKPLGVSLCLLMKWEAYPNRLPPHHPWSGSQEFCTTRHVKMLCELQNPSWMYQTNQWVQWMTWCEKRAKIRETFLYYFGKCDFYHFFPSSLVWGQKIIHF